jgi:hypothetical protein
VLSAVDSVVDVVEDATGAAVRPAELEIKPASHLARSAISATKTKGDMRQQVVTP